MWQSLLNFFKLNSHEVSTLFDGNVIFDESLSTKGATFEKLFQETENPILDGSREECQELICSTYFLLMKSHLRFQLTGEKYLAPNSKIRSHLKKCPTTSIVSGKYYA